jgi:hypothetical protein
VVNVHSENKIKRKRKGGGATVSIVTEAEDKIYRISFFKRRPTVIKVHTVKKIKT